MTVSPAGLSVLHVDTGREWRGGQRQVFYLTRGLTRLGIRSVVASPEGSPLATRLTAEQLAWRPLEAQSPYAPTSIRELRRLLEPEPYAIVHAHTAHAHSLAFLALELPGPSRPRPSLVVARRVDFEPKRDPFTRLKYRVRGQHFVCVSAAVRDVLARYGVEGSTLHVVHSGVETPEAPAGGARAASRSALREELQVPPGAPLVGTIGQLVPHKGHVHLIEAMKQVVSVLPEARLVVLGEGEERRGLEERIDELGLRSAVRLPGYLPQARRYLTAFDLYVSSSVEEGLGTSILDASRTGLAVVATTAGGSRETVSPERTGLLVEPGRPLPLAHAIVRLLRDPAERARLGAAGPAWVESHFSVSRMVEGTLEVYRQVLSVPATS